jgi:hypothetical protein
MQNLPTLTTEETQRLRSDYPCIEHLEAGNVASWLMERQEQLLIRAKDERTGMNIAKLITLTGGVVGAVCYATSPLALIGGTLAGAGYIWAVARDLNDSHQFAPLPFVRGNFIEFLSAMGDKEAREEWFASQNELVDLMFHLSPIERYEFGMLKQFIPNLTDFLAGVEGGKRFYAYRWLLDWYINLKGNLPTQDALNKHLAAVTVDPRVNYQQVSAIQQHQAQMLKPPPSQFVDLPQAQFVELPEPQFVEPSTVGTATKLNAMPSAESEATIETQAEVVTSSEPEASTSVVPVAEPQALPNLEELKQMHLRERAIAILNRLSTEGFDLSRCIADQITCICGNQRGGKGTLMAILAILSSAIDLSTKIHYFTAGDDIYPFKCDRLKCRLSYPDLDGDRADACVAQQLFSYLKEMDKQTQGACKDIILVIDEAVALSDYLDPDQKQWMIRFLLTRANKKGAQIFIVLHGKSLTSWVGTGNAGGFSQTFKTGATFIGCEATSIKLHPLRSISVATGHYFLADPDDFSKPVAGGDLGVISEWLKTEINPSTGQPDPTRTLLNFFPELRSDTQTLKASIDKEIEDSSSEEKEQSNVTKTSPDSDPSPETPLPERKLPPSDTEGSRKPDGISMEAFSVKIESALAEASPEASQTLPPLFEGLERDGKLLMLRLLLAKRLGKEKTILLAWGVKSGGRSHDKYRMASELIDSMIRDLSEFGFDEDNNWGIEQ